MQALYSWYQSEDKNTEIFLRELFRGTERTYDLYFSLLQVLPELADEEVRYYADLAPRHIAREEATLSRLSKNAFICFLQADPTFTEGLKKRKISWQKDAEIIKKVFFQLRMYLFLIRCILLKLEVPRNDFYLSL